MPIQRCTIGGNRGYKWGQQGTCYTGPNGRRKALRQAAAIKASQAGNARYVANTGLTEGTGAPLVNRAQIVPSNPLKADPTRSITLRKRFEAELFKRFLSLKGAILQLIVEEDAFGIRRDNLVAKESRLAFRAGGVQSVRNELTANTRWRFLTDARKTEEFAKWLQEQIDEKIITEAREQSLARFVEEGYRKGAGRAFDDTRKPALSATPEAPVSDFFNGTRQEFLRQSFNATETVDKLKLLVDRTFTDLVNVNDVMATQIRRTLADGLVRGQNPNVIARALNDRVDKIGITRSRVIARTEIIRAHAEGQLDSFEKLDVEAVGVMAEWSTAGDDRVCPQCQPLEGTVMTIKEARGIIPRHPQCRCTFIPANVGEDKSGQKRDRAQVDTAIGKSIKAEMPRRLKSAGRIEQRRFSRSALADKTIRKVRPKSVLDAPSKKVAPTPKSKSKPKPKPKAPVVPSLARRISENQTLAVVRKGVIDAVPDKKTLDRLAAERKSVLEEGLNKNSQQAVRLYEDTAQGKITLEARDAGLAVLDREAAKLSARVDSLNKQIDRIKFDANKRLENAIGVDINDRITINPKVADPVKTLNTKGEVFTTLAADVKFKAKLAEARQFIWRNTSRKTVSNLEFKVHQLPESSRAFHRSGLGADEGAFMAANSSVRTYVHELGHRLEDEIPNAKKLANEFRSMRIARAGTKDVKMADFCPDCGYGPDEVGNPDDWEKLFGAKHARYVGKSYKSGSTEVISMGLEKLFEDPVNMAKVDPEYFDFIVGILRGEL